MPSADEYAMAAGGPKTGTALAHEAHSRRTGYDLNGRSLVFARVVAEDYPSLHVGRRRVHENHEPVVVNWASDLGYQWLYGRSEGGLRLRRRLRCEDHVVTGFHDEVGSETPAVEADAAEEAEQSSWRDPLLDELARGRTGPMRDIVETIRREQLEAVDDRHPGVLVVQGGPGSGKSAVAVPRIARMLHRSESPLRADRVLLLGPSREFVAYLKGAFTSLGIEDVRRLDLPGLWNAGEAEHDSGLVGRFKSGHRMAVVLRRAVEDRLARPERALRKVCDDRDHFAFSLGSNATSVPLSRLLAAVREELAADLPYKVRAERCRNRLVALLEQAFREDFPHLRGDYTEQIEQRCHRTGLLDAVAPNLNPGDVLHRLLASTTVLERACSGIASDEEVRRLQERSDRYRRRRSWTYQDLVCLEELRFILEGPDPERFWDHLVIDEAQNVTPMEARELARRCPTGSMTVLGDLAQRLAPYPYFDWEELARTLAPNLKEKVVELRTGFRVPSEVMDFAAPLGRCCAPETAVPEAVLSRGAGSLEVISTFKPIADAAARALELARTESADRSIAVIIPRRTSAEGRDWDAEVHTALGSGSRREHARVSVLSAEAARGLEFDHVLVIEPRAFIADSDTGMQQLYIALTRATRTLSVLHCDDLPQILRDDITGEPEPARSDGQCARFRRGGLKCTNPCSDPGGWCRSEECEGFTDPTPSYRGFQLPSPASDGPLSDLLPPGPPRTDAVRVAAEAVLQFLECHGGSPSAATAEIRSMTADLLESGEVNRFPDGCIVAREGAYQIVFSRDSGEVVGYATGQPDLTHAQWKAGIEPRGAERTALADNESAAPDSGGSMPDEPPLVDWSVMTADEFEAMRILDRVQTEREDPDHEILRSDVYRELQLRRKSDGGSAGQGDGVDAWYEMDGRVVVFEVLELGGFDYHRFRKGAIDLMEAAHMYRQSGEAILVLVSQQPPDEPWTIKALKNIFGVLAAWPHQGGWDGPGAEHLRGTPR